MKVSKRMQSSFYPAHWARAYTIAAFCLGLTGLTGCSNLPWMTPAQAQTPEARVEAIAARMVSRPEDKELRNLWYREREDAIRKLLILAETAEAEGHYDTAAGFYARVLTLDANQRNALEFPARRARQQIVDQQIQAAKQQSGQPQQARRVLKDALLEQPTNLEARQLEHQWVSQDPKARAALPQLEIAINKPVTLELRDANIKVVFEALSRATGINFVLDKDIKPETKASVFVKKLPIEDAIDMVLASNALQKKVISSNSVLVFPATPQKSKDYQDLLIRNFYFTNTSAKQCADMLRTILKVRDIYIDERLNMLVIRERPEVMTLVEKMIRAQDIADPEVMLEIEVLEVTRGKLQQLGINYPSQLSVIGAPLTLEMLKSIKSSDIAVSPNPSVQFGAVNNDVDLLSNPRIRVKNNEKAKVQVGNKVPVITTNTITGGVTSESVSYVDVGLKLEVEPRILLDDFVNIKVNLEVSSLGEAVTLTNNSKVFNIGTRNASTMLRLKHGETQILAGLIQDSERKTINKLPGLGDIPVLGRLFGRNIDEKTKTEIVLAITPKILSNVALPEAVFSEYWSGTDAVISDKPLLQQSPANTVRSRAQVLREQQQQRQQELNDPSALTESILTSPDIAPAEQPPLTPANSDPAAVVEPPAVSPSASVPATVPQAGSAVVNAP